MFVLPWADERHSTCIWIHCWLRNVWSTTKATLFQGITFASIDLSHLGMFCIVLLHINNLNWGKCTLEFCQTMFLHKQIRCFASSLQFCLLGLLYCIHLLIFPRFHSINCWEVSRSYLLHLVELIHTSCFFLFGWRNDAVGFRAREFMSGPVFLLAVYSTIANVFAPGASKKLGFELFASEANLSFCLFCIWVFHDLNY